MHFRSLFCAAALALTSTIATAAVTDFPTRPIRYILANGPGSAPNPAAGPAPAAPEVGIDIAGALQQQLGLRLTKGKGMLDVIVVDKAEKVPTEN